MTDAERAKELSQAAVAAEKAEDWKNAVALYDELRRLTDRNADLIARHAFAVLKTGDQARAATMTRKATRLAPEEAKYHLQLGKIYLAQSRRDAAEGAFRKVLELEPDNIDGMRYLARAIQTSKSGHEEAEALLTRAAELDENNIAVWQQLGAIYGNDPERYENAEMAFRKALSLNPNLASTQHNLGLLRRFQADLEGAEELLRKACELEPTNSGFAFTLGSCLLFKEDIEGALKWFRRANELDEKNVAAAVYTAFALFHLGRMREGWEQYEQRLKLEELKDVNYSRPRWNGEDLNGETILLLREQGYGDNLQFVRYATMVAERGGKVILMSQKPLLRLFQSVPGISFVVHATPEPKYFRRYSPLMSLPYVFETDENSIPADVPYVQAVPEDVEAWRQRLKPYPGLKVGVTWRGNPGHTNDRFRSSSLEEMRQLFDIPGITFFSMVMNRPEFESDLPDGLVDITDGFADFASTAAAMENLDLVITVDTSICHLAGALARPVWTMLPRGGDFRWGIKGESTPWYPTMKLYRQATLGDWSDVYERMATDLREMAAGRS